TAHTLYLNNVANDFHFKGGVDAFAKNGEGDCRAFFSPHQIDGIVDAHALNCLIVKLDNQVASANTGVGSRGAVDGADHLDKTALHADLDTETTKFAAGAFLEIFKGIFAEISGMGVETRQHALDGVLEKYLIVHFLHIGAANLIKNLDEKLELVQRQAGILAVLAENPGGCSDQGRRQNDR